MKVVLAEKPSVARDIAAFVGARGRKDGYFEGQGYQITWAFGHLVTLKEPDEYDPSMKRWTLETLPFIPDDFLLKLTGDSGARKQFDIIAKLFRDADELICATDAGREGELIFRYIQKMSNCEKKPLKRLWLSSLTEQAIRGAFDDLRPGEDYDSLYAAARCRSESDWIVGLNATRNYTVRYGQGGVLWSVGRVQTPVLALIARRDDEIRNFIPEPFWEISTRYREVTFKHRGDRFTKEDDAKAVLTEIRDQEFAVDKVTRKLEKSQPPLLYDLTTLQRDMNSRFGLSAADTLKVAQNLYESKALTYPRTDSRYLSKDMQATMPGVMKALGRIKPNEVGPLDLSKLSTSKRIYDDKKISDHHAIIPTESTPGSLTGHAAAVYEMVVIRTISVFYPVCQKEITTVDGSVVKVLFRAKGIRVVDPGWTAIQPKRSKKDSGHKGKGDEEQDLPAFTKGETGPHQAEISEGVTKPPRHFSEASLLGAMETAGKLVEDEQLKEALKSKGIGTPATRAAIIETLLRRHYIVRDKKNLAATDLGRYLIALIQDPILKSPELTGDWEAKLKEIEMGQLEPQSFMAEISSFTHDLIRNSAMRMDPNGLGPCPRCGHAVIEGKRGYGCSDWKQGCSFVLWKDYRGHNIETYQARELLQRHISMRPLLLDDQRVVLCLSDRGFVMDILMPTRDMQRRGQGAKPAGSKTGSSKTSRAKGSTAAKGKTSGSASPKKKRSPKAQAPVVCPLCQKPMMETEQAFTCSAARSGCSFRIYKTIAGKKVSKTMAKKLLTSGKTQVLKGFQSKAGKAFDARLKLEDGKVSFEFEG